MPELVVTHDNISGSNDECQLSLDFSHVADLHVVLSALNLMDEARRLRATQPDREIYYGISPETLLVSRLTDTGRYVDYLSFHWPLEWATIHLRYAINRMQILRRGNE